MKTHLFTHNLNPKVDFQYPVEKKVMFSHQGRIYQTYGKSYQKLTGMRKSRCFLKLTALLAIGIFIIPLASHSYRKAIARTVKQSRKGNKIVTCTLKAIQNPKPNLIAVSPQRSSSLETELDHLMAHAQTVPPNGWRKGMGRAEKEQSLADFKACPIATANADRTSLQISLLGTFDDSELQVLNIVNDYLQAVHGLNTTLDCNAIPLDQKHMRKRTQYAYEPQLKTLTENLDSKTYALGFTNKDLYPFSHKDTVNFIYGVGDKQLAAGVFSICRLSEGSKSRTIKRLMLLAIHEFGHMRGIAHCTKFSCAMEGANGPQDMDKTPLLFCPKDMAKICHVNGWSLKEGYERQLQFFKTFSDRYNISIDFSKEIECLETILSL